MSLLLCVLRTSRWRFILYFLYLVGPLAWLNEALHADGNGEPCFFVWVGFIE